MTVTHALTFDIEEWFHLVGVPAMDDRTRWNDLQSSVEKLTDHILSILQDHRTHATFFTLGWVADRHPQLLRRIADAGHEIATHSYWHYEIYKHRPATFRADLGRSIDTLEQTTGQKVLGHRAPSFSLTPGSEWALDIMLDLGLRYDASAFPARRAHGGYPCSGDIHPMPTPTGRTLTQLPMSLYRLGPLRLPFSGGGYFRLCPAPIIHRALAQHEKQQRPAVVYLHPWDFDPAGPALPMPATSRIKCYLNRHTTEPKLRQVLQHYTFTSAANVLGM